MYLIVFFCHPINFLSFVCLCCRRMSMAVCKWRGLCYLVSVMTRWCILPTNVRIVVNAVQHLSRRWCVVSMWLSM